MNRSTNRYVKAVKIALNRLFGNKSCVNVDIAELITSFSHKSFIDSGDVMLSRDLVFFMVHERVSEHFVLGYFTPAQYEFEIHGAVYYRPQKVHWPRFRMKKKRIFNPYCWGHWAYFFLSLNMNARVVY